MFPKVHSIKHRLRNKFHEKSIQWVKELWKMLQKFSPLEETNAYEFISEVLQERNLLNLASTRISTKLTVDSLLTLFNFFSSETPLSF